VVSKKAMWMACASGAAMVGAGVVRKGLVTGWRAWKHEDPPEDPGAWDVDWRDAVAWTVATGALMGLGSLLARRGAAAGWRRLTGENPPY